MFTEIMSYTFKNENMLEVEESYKKIKKKVLRKFYLKKYLETGEAPVRVNQVVQEVR